MGHERHDQPWRVLASVVALVAVALALIVGLPSLGNADPSPGGPSGSPSDTPSDTPIPSDTPSDTPSDVPSSTPTPVESPSLGPAPSIGPAAQARRTVKRTCRAVITRYYESTDGGPFRLVRVERVPTGRICGPRDVAPATAGGGVPTAVAGGL